MSPPIQSAGLPEVLSMTYWDGERWLDQGASTPRTTSRARRVFDHSWKALLEGALVSLMVVGLIAGTAFAGKGNAGTSGGGGKTTTTAHGSCTADDTTVNAQYTIQGSGFKPGELLNVWVKDSGGTQTLFPPVDANGQFSATSWASWAGAYSVTVYNNGGRRLVWLTSCSFSVAP
jgi:hypothetical protein